MNKWLVDCVNFRSYISATKKPNLSMPVAGVTNSMLKGLDPQINPRQITEINHRVISETK